MPAKRDEPVTTATVVAQPAPMEAVKVQVEPTKYTPTLPTKRYWVGLLPTFKHRSQVDVAGVSFQKIITPPQVSSDGESFYRPEYLGQITSLSDEDVSRVTAKVVKKVVRGGHIVSLDNAHQRPLPGDEPLAKYLYMVRLPDDPAYMPPRDPKGKFPEPMAEEG